MRIRNILFLTALAVLPPMAAQGGSDRPPITIGMSTALSGPAQSLGLGMKAGMEAYFTRVNREGGLHGRELVLISMDDGYVPEAAAQNMVALIDDEKVLAVLGNVGTPTAKVTVPIATEKKTLLFGAFTGAGLLRPDPPNRYVINYRASYLQETAAMVHGLLAQGILPYQIAIFSQDDSYGDAGYAGVMRGLKEAGYVHGYRLAHGRYERNTQDVGKGLLEILETPIKPRAIIMIGAYGACAKFIRVARRSLPKAIYLNVSFVGSTALKNTLGRDSEGVLVTQVVPHYASDLTLTKEYRQDLQEFAPGTEPGFVALEGYVVARIFVEGLRRAGPEVDRESIIDALLSIHNLNIGLGTPIHYTRESYQGSQMVWPTVIRNGRFEPFNFASPATR
jgi:ABC-type branched-subunit amino acid transport system substrate-binding protein